jgi:nucleoside-diphosphate-sugar epimerase
MVARMAMNVVITGGAGFLGRRLAHRLLERGTMTADGREEPLDKLTLVDVVEAPPLDDPRVDQVAGDISDVALLERVIDDKTSSIFHLAAIVSGMAEADFDIGMKINVDGTRRLLDVCRARGHRPRVVFTSSVAVFGGDLPATVADDTVITPQTSYGTQKAIGELLLSDYTRKGFIDGRALRLPTISVRPGRPNAAASSFASSIIREPLNGVEAICPVEASTRLWLLSPRNAIECLIAGHNLASSVLGWNRVVNLPGISVTVAEMVAALERVAGKEVAARVRFEIDPRIKRLVDTWPGRLAASRARQLGFPADDNFDVVIRQHIADTKNLAIR